MELPRCTCRAVAADGTLECDHPRVRLARITPATCRRCPWSDAPPPRPAPRTLLEVLPCPHRGERTGATVPNALCGCHGRDEPVYACALFGACTLRRVSRRSDRRADCLGCAARG